MFKLLLLSTFLFVFADSGTTPKKNPQDVSLFTYKGVSYKFLDIFEIIQQGLKNRKIESLSEKEIEQLLKSSIKSSLRDSEIFNKNKNKNFEKNEKFKKRWLKAVKGFVISCAIEEKADSIKDSEAKAYYDKNIRIFTSNRFNLSLILLKDEPKANLVYKALINNPENFENIAQTDNMSEDLKKTKGMIDLREEDIIAFFGKENYEKIQKSGTRKVVLIKFNGFFAVLKVNKKTTMQKAFEEVKESIKPILALEQLDKEADQEILNNEKNGQLVIFPEESKEKQIKFQELLN